MPTKKLLPLPRKLSTAQLGILVAGVVAVGVYVVYRGFAGVPVQPAALGVYTGPAGVQSHDNFSNSLGRDASYALDFADDSQPWENIASYSDWLMDPWSTWTKAKPDRRLVVSLPMLNQASAGQLVQGKDGAFDQYFKTFAEELIAKDLGNSVIRLGWEANGDWYPWKASTNPQAWKDYYRRIVGVMRATTVTGKPAPTFQFDLTYNLGTSGTANTFESMYPGDDVVDIIGLDAYDVKWMDATSTPGVRWNNLLTQQMGLNEFKAFAAAHNKPMSIPEWGLWPKGTQDGGGGDNPYYIDRMADWIEANKSSLAYQSYFNHLSGGTDGDHRLSSYPSSQSRFISRFSVTATQPTVNIYNTYRTSSTVFKDEIIIDGQTVSGGLALRAAPVSTNGVSRVEFHIDNPNDTTKTPFSTVAYNSAEPNAPYCMAGRGTGTDSCYLWNTRSVSNGPHTITAYAHDSSGARSPAKTISFVVNNIDTNNPRWETLYRDDFDTLNTTSTAPNSWSLYNSPGHANHGLRRPSAITASSGNLVITANNQDTDGNGSLDKVVSGGMSNRTKSVYGKYEIRAKTEPDPTGTMSGVVLTWPADAYDNMIWGENDFYETGHAANATSRNPFKSFIHWPNTYRTEPYKQTSFTHPSDAVQWHKVIMEWTAEYVNIKSYKDPDPSTLSDDVLLLDQTMLESSDPREQIPDNNHRVTIQLDAFLDSLLTQDVRMYVDYLQVYKLVPGSSSDITPPSVSWTKPASGATISGYMFDAATSGPSGPCEASASDSGGIAKVIFYIDGTLLNTEGAAPYNCKFDTTQVADGARTLKAEAHDTAGNISSATRTVNVQNTTPPPPAKQGDINNDNVVNIFDLSILLSNYAKPIAQASDPDCDINANGTVDIFDLSILLSKYGT